MRLIILSIWFLLLCMTFIVGNALHELRDANVRLEKINSELLKLSMESGEL